MTAATMSLIGMMATVQTAVAPLDLVPLVATVMGLLVVLIPISGLTARFALKPVVEAVARMRESQGSPREVAILEQRVALLEQQLSNVETDVNRLEESRDFERQLRAGEADA